MKYLQEVTGSSSIKKIATEEKNGLHLLTVEFIGGGRYTYTNVPDSIVKEFIDAESKGKYFAANIKNKFVTEKLEDKTNIPVDSRFEEFLEWTEEEEQAFLDILNKE